jgi:two-component system sensor histidine kinase EvgS
VLLCCAPLLAADQLPQLHGRSTFSGPRLTPDEAQLRWLWERQQLRLAVVRPDNPPLDILGTGRDYEGISADYAGLLAGHLQLPVQIRVYASLNAAIEALRAHEVDLLASVTARQASDAACGCRNPMRKTCQWWCCERMNQRPMCLCAWPCAKATAGSTACSLDILRRRSRYSLHPCSAGCLGLWPGRPLPGWRTGKSVPDRQGAGRAVGSLRQSRLENQPLGFAMHPHDAPLHGLVDAVLASIEPQEHARIRRRWGGQGLVERGSLQLSDKELSWVQGQGPLRVLLNDQYPPISYRDGEGRLRGLAVDVLQRIGRRTGLTFDLVAGGTLERMIERTAGARPT